MRTNTRTRRNPLAKTIGMTCDIGHPDGLGHGHHKPCTRPADYTGNYHCCPAYQAQVPGVGDGTAIWCTEHLSWYATAIVHALRAARQSGKPLHCAGCHQPMNTFSDMLWNVLPLK